MVCLSKDRATGEFNAVAHTWAGGLYPTTWLWTSAWLDERFWPRTWETECLCFQHRTLCTATLGASMDPQNAKTTARTSRLESYVLKCFESYSIFPNKILTNSTRQDGSTVSSFDPSFCFECGRTRRHASDGLWGTTATTNRGLWSARTSTTRLRAANRGGSWLLVGNSWNLLGSTPIGFA